MSGYGSCKNCCQQIALASGADSPALEPVAGSAAKGKRRILIVDDDSNSPHFVEIPLEDRAPYLVLEENDATKADETAHNFKDSAHNRLHGLLQLVT